MPEGFDSLTHLDAPALRGRLPEILARSREAGVTGWLVAGSDPASWTDIVETAQEADAILALGVHPSAATEAIEARAWLDSFEPPVVGEIGLDHRPNMPTRAVQRRVLRSQLAWARERERPVVLHAVRAVPEVLHILRRDGLGRRGGVLHGWTAHPDLAVEAVELGLHLGIGPPLLRRNAHKIEASLCRVPRERVLLESDAPDQPWPGCAEPQPSDLVQIAAAVALLWSVDVGFVLDLTGRSARALFADPIAT